jgi:hypothetical protein
MNALLRLIGMIRSPRQTLAAGIARPRPLDLAVLILLISAACSVLFLMTRVGRLAALDQQVRQLESMGTVVTDRVYAELRSWEPYRPLISATSIVVGWPLMWAAGTAVILAVRKRAAVRQKPDTTDVTFAQVFTVLVYASSVFALRALVALPINFMRESLGGATSVGVMVPGLGDATFAARLFGAIDIFALWWVALVAVGLGMLYRTRAFSVARWLLGAYATGAAALALTQALRGGA